MKAGQFLAVAGLLLITRHAAVAADFYVRMTGVADAEARSRIQSTLNAKLLGEVPSLGKGIEVWRSTSDAHTVQDWLRSEQSVSLHDEITGDYRNFFTQVSQGADLQPDVARNLEAVRKRPTTKEVNVVRTKSSDLTRAMLLNGFGTTDGFASKGTVRLNLFPQLNAVAVKTDVVPHDLSSFTWSGVVQRLADQQPGGATTAGLASLSIQGSDVIGRVSVGKDVYTITPLGRGYHAIAKIDPSRFPPEHPASQKMLETKPSRLTPAPEQKDVSPKLLKNSDGTVNDIAPAPMISVGVVYTQAAAAQLGAVTPDQFSRSLIDASNQSYDLSRIQVHLRLAGTTTAPYQESDFDVDVPALVAPEPGTPLAAIHDWRKQIKANVVVLVVALNDACGEAAAIGAEASTAFALVSETCALDNLSFPHEVGHLQGARHDPAADPSSSPYSYGHGYMLKGKWRTIMAYPGDCECNRIGYWSNPAVLKDGDPMGTPDVNDNAMVLNQTAPKVARFQP
jgi:peptidyl-Asp metalloendopeptidase